MLKVWTWVLTNGASVLGIVQSVVKAIKELLTAVVNIISIFMPKEKAEALVKFVRDLVNKIDDWIEVIKEKLL